MKLFVFNKLLILVFLFIPLSVQATTYYVNVGTGNDTNPGTQGSPFATIQKAATLVNPGDIVIVQNGVYIDTNVDGSIVNLSRSGSAGNLITFKSENKWGAKLDGQSNTTAEGFKISGGATYIRIQDFEFYGMGNGG